jgi:hypothetical protein
MEYVKIESNIETTENETTLTAIVKNGKYLVGVCSFLDDFQSNKDAIDVFLLVDDSGSMYDEMMDGAGNDPSYKRFDMCTGSVGNAVSITIYLSGGFIYTANDGVIGFEKNIIALGIDDVSLVVK